MFSDSLILAYVFGKQSGFFSEQINCFRIFDGRLLPDCQCITLCKKVRLITNMYGPNDYSERIFMARITLILLTSRVGGDSNITRWAEERFPIGSSPEGSRLIPFYNDRKALIPYVGTLASNKGKKFVRVVISNRKIKMRNSYGQVWK